MGKSALSAASNAESVRIAFETMLGSKEKAQALQAQIVELASATPFELTELTDYTKQLLAMGVSQETVIDDLKSLGNIAAGVGKDKLPQLTFAFGQVRAAGRLTGEELNQFTEAGVPLLETLAKQAGTTASAMKKAISDGKVNFEQVRSALASLSGEGGKFFNLMERQSKTLDGQLSNLSDSFGQLQVSIGERLTPIAKSFTAALGGIVGTLQDWFAIPMSEKIQEEQADLNALVGVIVTTNDNYEMRSALVSELTQKYPEFLAGIDAETASNDQLIERLERVNQLYEKRIATQVVKEQTTKLQEQLNELTAAQFQARQEVIRQIRAQGVEISLADLEEASKKGKAELAKFFQEQAKKAGLQLTGRQTKEGLSSGETPIARLIRQATSDLSNQQQELGKKQAELLQVQRQEQDLKVSNGKANITQSQKALADAQKALADATAAKNQSQIIYYQGVVERQTVELAKVQKSVDEIEVGILQEQIKQKNMVINSAESEIRTIMGQAEFQTSKTLQIAADSHRDRQRRNITDRDALIAQVAAIEARLKKGTKTPEAVDADAQKKAEQAIARAKELADKRLKAKQDIGDELRRMNIEIANIENADQFQSVERIRKKVNAEIDTEKELVARRIANYKAELIKLGVSKAKAEEESNTTFAPLLQSIEQKRAVRLVKDVDTFKKEVERVTKANNEAILGIELDLENDRINQIKDAQAKENALIEQDYQKRVVDTKNRFETLRTQAKSEYEKGLLSVAESDTQALAESKRRYELYLAQISSLEDAANRRDALNRYNRILVANQQALDAARENARQFSQDLQNEFDVTGDARQRSKAAQQYTAGEITWEQYQKRLNEIQQQNEKIRIQRAITELEVEKRLIQERIDLTNKANSGQALTDVEAQKVLSDADLKKAQSEFKRINAEIATQQANSQAATAQNSQAVQQANKQKTLAYIDSFNQITNVAISAFQQIEQAELAYYDRSLQAQQARIEQAKVLRDRGNVEYLEEEQKRLIKIEEERRKALARQQFLDRLAQLSSVAVGVARAFADAPAGGAGTIIKITAALSALAGAYAAINTLVPQPQRFAKGTRSVQRGDNPSGIDTVPALLTEGERVTDAQTNALYKDSYDYIESKKLSPDETIARLKGLPMPNYSKMGEAAESLMIGKNKAMERTNELLEKSISQNDEMMKVMKSQERINFSMDSRGFSLSLQQYQYREQKRKS